MARIIIAKNKAGWGGPLSIPVDHNKKVVSVTGTGIHPVARAIAAAAGVEVIDGFKEGIKDQDMLCVVINCAGTLRCGVYPQKNIPTINTNPIGPSGPLEKFINEGNYISGTTVDDITFSEGEGETQVQNSSRIAEENRTQKEEAGKIQKVQEAQKGREYKQNVIMGFIQKMGTVIGLGISILYDSGKESVNIILKSVIPFMAFVSAIVAIILYSGLGKLLANALKPLAGSLPGLLLISAICGIPVLSPMLGPGGAFAQVIGVLLGTEIGLGHIPPQYALPVLFAINVQVGADFVPVGLSMQEAEPDTVKYGVPAFLLSRQITGPIAVVLAYFMSFGLFK